MNGLYKRDMSAQFILFTATKYNVIIDLHSTNVDVFRPVLNKVSMN